MDDYTHWANAHEDAVSQLEETWPDLPVERIVASYLLAMARHACPLAAPTPMPSAEELLAELDARPD